MRAEAEETYGQKLSEIAPSVDKIQGGFGKDDGASLRKVRLRALVHNQLQKDLALTILPHF